MHPLAEGLLKWYGTAKRDLPWRQTSDPYRIWLSEIILQQTRVNQGLPYYLKFIEEYPDVDALAAASEEKVLRTWQGLGYYSRARNLHKCAKKVVADHNSIFPSTYDELLQLPGIGPYTAAAISSIAFNENKPVVDGNVLRVMTRVFGISDDVTKPATHREIRRLLEEIIPRENPGTFNQAIMELGATVCSPRSPTCLLCPCQPACHAYQHAAQAQYPVKSKKTKVRKRYLNYLVYTRKGKMLMKKREQKDIWQGLYDFPVIESQRGHNMEEETSLVQESQGPYKHVLSHQEIYASFHRMKGEPEQSGEHNWYTPEEIESLPKPILIDRYLNDHGF